MKEHVSFGEHQNPKLWQEVYRVMVSKSSPNNNQNRDVVHTSNVNGEGKAGIQQ